MKKEEILGFMNEEQLVVAAFDDFIDRNFPDGFTVNTSIADIRKCISVQAAQKFVKEITENSDETGFLKALGNVYQDVVSDRENDIVNGFCDYYLKYCQKSFPDSDLTKYVESSLQEGKLKPALSLKIVQRGLEKYSYSLGNLTDYSRGSSYLRK